VEPVLYNTPGDQGNLSDCTGCQNTQDISPLNENLNLMVQIKFLNFYLYI
jgi:hypothetical protein